MSITIDAILKKSQSIARLEKNLSLQKLKARKADTRRKIEFGGLVIKAGMDKHSKAVILGALIDALDNLENDKHYKKLCKMKGERAFMGFDGD